MMRFGTVKGKLNQCQALTNCQGLMIMNLYFNNMETALSTISVLPSTREEFYNFKRMLKAEILNGQTELLPTLAKLTIAMRSIEDTLKDEDVERAMVNELSQYSSKEETSINGVKFNLQETGTKYHYKDSGDPVWNDLDKQIQELTEKRKARETFLKAIPYESNVVDAETGLYLTRPPKTSTTKVVVKIQ